MNEENLILSDFGLLMMINLGAFDLIVKFGSVAFGTLV